MKLPAATLHRKPENKSQASPTRKPSHDDYDDWHDDDDDDGLIQ